MLVSHPQGFVFNPTESWNSLIKTYYILFYPYAPHVFRDVRDCGMDADAYRDNFVSNITTLARLTSYLNPALDPIYDLTLNLPKSALTLCNRFHRDGGIKCFF